MRSEKYRSRIMVQQLSGGQDSAGQPIEDWVDLIPLWADIRYKKGVEAIKADAPTALASASIRIRYRTGLDASMRVVHGSEVYGIKAILPDKAKREYIDLVCEVVG